MAANPQPLTPASQLAAENTARMPNESAEYRAARNALLAEEIELRRQLERVAALRRALPPGGLVTGDYRFDTEDGPTDLAGLFGDKQTLAVYSYMFGPHRQRPCPMCTNLLDAWDGNAEDAAQKMSLVVVARSPIQRLIDWKRERGWKALRLVSDVTGDYSRDYLALRPDGGEDGILNVFTRRDGSLRHFWGGEMDDVTADPGQDPRGPSNTVAPLWGLLDATPEGRDPDWYPKLSYE
jgi:predicted dithiol-disulfide oxidoreductase (DUF899 family)